jgi:hypothetical protein
MPPAGFEPAIPESERPQTHALERAAPGIGNGTSRLGFMTRYFYRMMEEEPAYETLCLSSMYTSEIVKCVP